MCINLDFCELPWLVLCPQAGFVVPSCGAPLCTPVSQPHPCTLHSGENTFMWFLQSEMFSLIAGPFYMLLFWLEHYSLLFNLLSPYSLVSWTTCCDPIIHLITVAYPISLIDYKLHKDKRPFFLFTAMSSMLVKVFGALWLLKYLFKELVYLT